MGDTAIIRAEGLCRTYTVFEKQPGLIGSIRSLWNRKFRTVVAVDNVNFTVEPGEIVGFLGPNGAGKTTTLKMLSGLIYPSSGTASALGSVPTVFAGNFRL